MNLKPAYKQYDSEIESLIRINDYYTKDEMHTSGKSSTFLYFAYEI